jgi:hypothetical protein
MQYKRPINVARTRKTGIPTWVNSFQFLRANKLVLGEVERAGQRLGDSARGHGAVQGRPADGAGAGRMESLEGQARPEERQDTDLAVYRLAGESLADTLRNACHALDKAVVTYTESDGEELWELLDAFAKRLKKAGIERPTRPRGRPRAITIIEVDDGGQTRWLPNFHPPGTPEHERYDEAMRRAGKKPGDPL